MRKLVLARPADYDDIDSLQRVGVVQMHWLGLKLSALNARSQLIMRDKSRAGVYSANILHGVLRAPVESNEIASPQSGSSRSSEFFSMWRSFNSRNVDVLIVLTTSEYVETFPNYIFKNAFGEVKIISPNLKKGEAILIDSQNESYTLIQRDEIYERMVRAESGSSIKESV